MSPEQDSFFEGLYYQYFKRLMVYANTALGDPERAQDVVQDTFHEALRRIDVVSVHENPGGWLMQTLKYKIRESERDRQRQLRRFLSLDTDPRAEMLASVLQTDPLDGVGDAPVLDQLDALLTPEERRLLKRLIFDGAGHLQVAKEFGITVYASQKRLQRVREKLYIAFPERKKKRGR